MKQIKWQPIVLFLGIALYPAVTVADARGICGYWLSEKRDGLIEMSVCGEMLCGRLVWLRDALDEQGNERRDTSNPHAELRERRIAGLTILSGFTIEPEARGRWTGGRIYDPESGKTYKCKMHLVSERVLGIRGYVGVPLLGKTTRWARLSAGEAARFRGGETDPPPAADGEVLTEP